MPKAHLTTRTGAKLTVEGSAEEVALIVRQIQGDNSTPSGRRRATRQLRRPSAGQRATPTTLILSLIEDGFFKKPKDLPAVKAALEEKGHHYPVTTLSPSLLRLVRTRRVRRIKQEKRWFYTG